MIPDSRWTRLERYARFRSKRLPLQTLPYELIAHVSSFLSPQDTHFLLAALFAPTQYRLDPWQSGDVQVVVPELRRAWLIKVLYARFEHWLNTILAECALSCCYDTSSIVAVADWSPFHPSPPCALAEYSWSRHKPQRVVLYYQTVTDVWNRHCICGLPSARITLHKVLRWQHVKHFHNDEISNHTILLFPPFLIGPSARL